MTENIRESYLFMPRWAQPFLTWLTGKPLSNQKPLLVLGSCFHFLCPMFMVLLGIACVVWINDVGTITTRILLIPLLWVIIVSGARKLALTVRHQCVHHQFTGIKTLDIFLAELATSVLCSQDAISYKTDHARLHHRLNLLGTLEDPHVKTLHKYGFIPGLSKAVLWRHLLLTLVSPVFHYRYTLDRIKYNFIKPHWWRIALSILFWVCFLTLLALSQHPIMNFILAYAIPIVIFYNISAILEILSEHPLTIWMSEVEVSDKSAYSYKAWAIMCGSKIPEKGLRGFTQYASWTVWFVRMLGHLLVRCTVLCGDLSAHDLHHRKPGQYDWRISIYERQRDIDLDNGEPEYRDIWGFITAIDAVLASYGATRHPDHSINHGIEDHLVQPEGTSL